jgi:TatA/E family protein of Tat protein translocase
LPFCFPQPARLRLRSETRHTPALAGHRGARAIIDSEDLAGGISMIFGNFSPQEFILIFLVALILFGPKKLPEIGRKVGKALTEFRRASSELKATFDREMKNLEAETGIKEVVNQYQYDTYNYDYSSYDTTYDGAYVAPSLEPAANPSTASASATEGAESPALAAPEGTIAYVPATEDEGVSSGPAAITAGGDHSPTPASANAEQQA